MNESGLIEQVLRIINHNYSNIYVIDIKEDKVYAFEFTVTNSLIIKEVLTYTKFIEIASSFVNKEELSSYFDALSLNKLELESQKGNSEIKVKYRKLCETGEYRWFVNIINYLPFEGKKLIFMMSEDINDRLTDSENKSLKLENEVSNYKKRLTEDSENISDALYQINNLLENDASTSLFKLRDTKEYINSVFNRISIDNPELKTAIVNKLKTTTNYRKPSILIVDDSSIIRNSLKRIFADEFNILMAKNGDEAIEIITKNALNPGSDVIKENIVGVLLDLLMPESDGFTVLEFMKRNNLFSKIPVAIISGDETKETRKKVYQYEIVDMLEKPFNTDNIRRRITKIINLYMSGNNLSNIVEIQNTELQKAPDQALVDDLKIILNQIVNNILNSNDSKRIKKLVRVLTISLANKYPKYQIDPKYIDHIVNTCALYNVGSIAMSEDDVITSASIQKEIDFGLSIINNLIKEPEELKVAQNIIKYSCEMYNGKGYPNNISGDNIPIEAQITNVIVRLNQQTKNKNFNTAIKQILDDEVGKYNPDIILCLDEVKNELKEIIS